MLQPSKISVNHTDIQLWPEQALSTWLKSTERRQGWLLTWKNTSMQTTLNVKVLQRILLTVNRSSQLVVVLRLNFKICNSTGTRSTSAVLQTEDSLTRASFLQPHHRHPQDPLVQLLHSMLRQSLPSSHQWPDLKSLTSKRASAKNKSKLLWLSSAQPRSKHSKLRLPLANSWTWRGAAQTEDTLIPVSTLAQLQADHQMLQEVPTWHQLSSPTLRTWHHHRLLHPSRSQPQPNSQIWAPPFPETRLTPSCTSWPQLRCKKSWARCQLKRSSLSDHHHLMRSLLYETEIW